MGGTYVFTSLREALLAADSIQRVAPQGTFTEECPLTIRIAPSVYWLDDPDDPSVRKPLPGEGIPYGLKLVLNHVCLVGLDSNAEHTILACNRGQTQGAVGNFTMLHLTGEDIWFENLTLANYCNVDLVYPLDPSLNRKRRADAIVQAQLAICHGDRIAAKNCRFISRLNTCPLVGARRTYFEDCYFECTDDALCGTGIHYRCRFTLFSGKPFYSTQGTGAVFLDCDLHSLTTGRQYLVKVGSPVSMVDCRWTTEHPTTTLRWTQDPTDDLRSYQHRITLNGQPVLIDEGRSHLTVDMTGKPLLEAYRLTLPKRLFCPGTTGDTLVYNLFNLTAGSDGWNPANQPVEVMKAYAGKPVGMTLNHRRAHLETGRDTLHLKASVQNFMQRPDFSPMRRALCWQVVEGNPACVKLIPLADGSIHVIGDNHGETPMDLQLVATDSVGLQAACVVTVHPRQLPSPTFIAPPSITRKGDTLHVNYTLDLQDRADQSVITWYRCTSPQGDNAVAVATSRENSPLCSYVLTEADNGYYLRVSVSPKHLRSTVGPALWCTTSSPFFVSHKVTDSLDVDILHFPTFRQPLILPGFWTLDTHKPADTREFDWVADTLHSPWHYGQGVDGAAHSYGLIQSQRGARLLYTPVEGDYGDMELLLHVSPCKTAGQGFGSATGQYMDICIQMDTRTLTGYALRIIRTTKHDKAVDFQLMKYHRGIVTPISEAVSSICYRAGCVIRLAVNGHRLTATVHNSNPLPPLHREGLTSEVHLSAPISPLSFGGVGILHTGSVGASATVIEKIQITWR